MRSRALLIPGLILGLLLGSAVAAPAQDAGSAPSSSGEVIVLPFANYSGRYEALSAVLPVFYEELTRTGLRVMSHEELRPILRRHRIRVVGQVGRRAMDALRQETGARLAIVGSIDVYEPERAFEVMVSARLVDLDDYQVLTALSVGRAVQETERAFGRGRAEEIRDVVRPVVVDFMERLRPWLAGRAGTPDSYHKCGLVSVVPLEDYSERRHGAEVLQNLLMAELVGAGWRIVEPGVVHEILLDEQQMARGGVSEDVMRILREGLGVCYVVTGELEEFTLAPSPRDAAVPRLVYGLRLIDVRRSRLVDAIEQTRDGMDGETLFALGIEYSMARLARESMSDVVEWIANQGDQ